jgi:D-glucosaminate-6-phosphate ammonia-lyase
MSDGSTGVYEELGVRPVINAQGNRTVIGGSSLSRAIAEARDQANERYVPMEELLQKSGEYIAQLVGTEAAYVTSGCCAALALSACACLAGDDPEKMAQLPDTSGMANEIIVLQAQRYSYDRCYTVSGARLVPVGDDKGCSADQIEAAIGPKTAAVAYLINSAADDGCVSLEEAVEVAHRNGLPAIADAAAQLYPLDFFMRNAQAADLVCFGGKYVGAPHSTGFLCGRSDLVKSASDQGFIGFQTGGGQALGRAMKVDRQDVVALVAALRTWLTMNHEDRLMEYDSRLSVVQRTLRSIPGVEARISRVSHYFGLSLKVSLDVEKIGKTAHRVARDLDEGEPRIWVMTDDSSDTFTVNAHALNEGEDKIVAERLSEALKG